MTIQNPAPYFVVGAVRSGTTVLRLLLGHHPQICRCEEFEYVLPAIVGRNDWPATAPYVQWLAQRRDFRASGYRPDAALAFPDLARDFLVQLQAMDAKPVVGATVHNHYDELPRLWPEAKYIHLDRDPRDVARSCVEMGWNGNAWAGVETWIRSHEEWQHLCRRVPAERRIEVKFEEFVIDADATLRRITQFLGVEFDPAMFEIEGDTTYKRPNPRGARSWCDDAGETEVREMEARLGDRLAQAGYAPSGLPPLAIGPMRERALRWKDRIGRQRFAMRRYGALTWIGSRLSQRLLPIGALRKRTQATIDRIDELHLK